MPAKFDKSALAVGVGALVLRSHAPAKLHTQVGRPGGLNPLVGHVTAAAARLPI